MNEVRIDDSRPAVLAGRYRLQERIGQSRLGTVYRATPIDRDRTVALTLLTGLPADAEGRLAARFGDLMRPIADLSHPYILPVLDSGDDNGTPFLVTELSAGGSLADSIGAPMPLWDALPIAREIGDALDYAHGRGIVHGGLSASAVLLRVRGSVALTEFGLAALAWLAPGGQRLALPGLVAPEQRQGDPASRLSDVWAFGALLYAMLTGQLPGDQPTPPSRLAAGLPAFADAAILAALSADPADRPSSAGALVRAAFGASSPAPVEPAAPPLPLLLVHHRTPKPADPTSPPAVAPAAMPIVPAASLAMPAPLLSPVTPPVAVAPDPMRAGSVASAPLTTGPIVSIAPGMATAVFHRVEVAPRPRIRRLELLAAVLAVILVGSVIGRYADAGRPRLSSATVPSISSSSPPGNWTMLGHDPARTSAAIESTSTLEGKVGWTASLNAPATSAVVVGPGGVMVGTNDGRIVAIDPANGKTRWEYRANGPIVAGPAQTDGLTYVGLRDGRVLAIDTQGGTLRWEARTNGAISAAPVAVDGVLLVGSNDGTLRALDAGSGLPRWEYDAGEPIDAPPAIGNGLILLATRLGKLHVLDAVSGGQRLVYRGNGGIEVSPVLAGGFAYVMTDRGTLQALDPLAQGGPFAWQLREMQAWAYQVGLPVGLPGPQPGHRWYVAAGSPVRGSLAVGPRLVYYTAADGSVQAVDAVTGDRRWNVKLAAASSTGPIVAGEMVYVATTDGRLAVLDATSGQKLWEVALPGSIRTAPALARGMVFIATDDGKLYALK